MKRKAIVFLIILIISISYGTGNYEIKEFKLIPDSIQLINIGMDLFHNYDIEMPKYNFCQNNGWRSLRKPLPQKINVTKTKTEEIDFKTFVDYYDISESKKHILSFKTQYEPTGNAIRSQFSWTNNWVIEYNDHVILNGHDLNNQNGYSKSYCFNFFKNRPVYFFEKNGKSYLQIDSVDISLNFQNIIHYYCCEPGIFNPNFDDCRISFYAQKNGYWYRVLIEEKK